MNTSQFLNYSVIVLYFIIVIAIGFYCSRGEKTSENYLLGGRRMGYMSIGIACMMALLSSISLVMVPGEICNHGATFFSISQTLGLLLGIPAYLLFTRFYFRLGSFTPYEYLEYRYDSKVRALVAITGFYGGMIYQGTVLYTTAKIFEATSNWPAWFSILLVGGVGMVYTFTGGAKAVVWTDVMQFFVLVGSFAVVILFLSCKIDGGAIAAVKIACEHGHGFSEFADPQFYTINPYVRLLFWLMFIGAFISPLTRAASDSGTIQRLLSTGDWKAGFKAKVIATLFSIVFGVVLWFVGMAIYTYYTQNPDPAVNFAANQGDKAFFRFVYTQLPAPVPGLFIAGILAAIMSTISSGMNSMSAVWLKEFHSKFINKHMTPQDEYRISRWGTFYLGLFIILFGLALDFSGRWLQQSVAEVGTIFGILGAGVLPAYLFAVLSDRANSKLIWGITIFGFGSAVGSNIWYMLSRNAEQFYQNSVIAAVRQAISSGAVEITSYAQAAELAVKDHISLSGISVPAELGTRLHLLNPETIQLGWGGKISLVLPIFFGMLFLLCCLPWFFKAIRHKLSVTISACIGLVFLGIAQWMFLWWFFGNIYITDHPMARSFAFGLPLDLIGAFIFLWFCPHQPKEKYQGLTLQTIHMPILRSRETKGEKS